MVEVAAGHYPAQQILVDRSKTSSRRVVFRPARGAVVVLDGLRLGSGDPADGPRHLVFRNMRTAYVSPTEQSSAVALPGTRNVLWKNIDAGNFHLWGVRNFTVRGGDWGPCYAGRDVRCGNSKIDAGPPGYPTRNVLIEGARFHDYRFGPTCYEPGMDCHFECMYVNASHGVTIRRSKFRDCALYDIFVSISGSAAGAVGHKDLTIESNWFDTPWDENAENPRRVRPTAVTLAWCQNSPHGYRNVRIRFNSFQSTTGVELYAPPSCVFSGVRVTGNLLLYGGSCEPRARYAYNLWGTAWRTGRCSSTDKIVGPSFPYVDGRSGRGFDFHLRKRRKTLADDLVPRSAPGGCPARDIDGQRRPLERRCDAGSDERRRPRRR